MLTEAQRAQQREQRRAATKGAVRSTKGAAALQRIRQKAHMLGQSAVLDSVLELIAVRDGLRRGATVADRVRACSEILDRFGFPKMSQQELVGDFPVKLYDLRGWDGPEGPKPPEKTEESTH